MANLVEQAEEATRSGDWSQLSYYLQQRLTTEQTAPLEQTELEFWLASALTVLHHGDFQNRWDVAKVIPNFGDAAIVPLIRLLRSEADSEVGWFVIRILGQFQHPDAIQALLEVLENGDDDDLNQIAATTLANLGTAAVSSFTPLLANAATRPLAVRSLAQIRHPATIAPLLQVTNDPLDSTRKIAIEALSSFHDPGIPPVLIHALDDLSAAVRQAAVEGLGARPDLAEPLNLVDLLAHRLRDINLAVCQQAAIALGRIGTDTALQALFQTLRPSTPIALQRDLVRALGWTETSASLDYLQQALCLLEPFDSSDAVYEEIVTILGRWTATSLKPKAAQILISTLTAKSTAASQPAVKQAAALGLGHLGQKQALESLIQLLADEDLGVRLHAIAALKALDPQAAQQQLKNLQEKVDVPAALKQGATLALQEW